MDSFHGYATTALGRIIVRWNARGVTETAFTEDVGSESGERDDMHPFVLAASQAACGMHPGEVLLDLSGTDFQKAVWTAISSIARGRTATYAEIAAKAGRPRATRAAAAACAANRIALFIPCHRVIRTGGELSGYRWGAMRKEALLRAEGAPIPGYS